MKAREEGKAIDRAEVEEEKGPSASARSTLDGEREDWAPEWRGMLPTELV